MVELWGMERGGCSYSITAQAVSNSLQHKKMQQSSSAVFPSSCGAQEGEKPVPMRLSKRWESLGDYDWQN